MADRHQASKEATQRSVLDGPGFTSSSLRRAVASGEPPEELRALVAKIRDHAYRVTDEDITALRRRYSEDELYEIIVAAAIGAAEHRVGKALAALEDA